ncbi:hypothetical protein B0H17DRAFT_1091330 [Mycena rosella]|uniref:Zn(2)-C6 fungal-type domain-containing protein n=1 Tax=Mycena rosella TaxID=1033263 RepID=A0AAD7G7N7_MYCRO|nr:hypothetical protein B0H17DRAFT_1091330 [Mycena rosella]
MYLNYHESLFTPSAMDAGGSSQYTSNLARGGACSNCRRRKIKCDGGRPICNQCHTAAQLQETIASLKTRINELERVSGQSGPQVLLQQPYSPGPSGAKRGSSSPEAMSRGPPTAAKLVDRFLSRFTNNGCFFLEPLQFYDSALARLPSGHPDRPSPALLSAIYLWGCVLCSTPPSPPYTEDTFLRDALQSLPGDISRFNQHPKLVLETIQAEVLLSLYYLHAAIPVQGRYHATAAATLALSAGLHKMRAPSSPMAPGFLLAAPLFPPALDMRGEAERIDAFWAVVTLNNFWVAAEGCPSAIPYGMAIDTPWPLSSQGGATVTKFLNGDDQEGRSPVALLTKASILLERIIDSSARNNASPSDAAARYALENRLHTFQSSLPNAMGSQPLVMAHALTDLAIVRFHAPLARTSESARNKCLTAAHRAAAGLASAKLAQPADPMLGPLYAALSAVYIHEMAALRARAGGAQARAQYQDLDARVGSLVGAMTALAPKSPVIQVCLASTRQAYGELPYPR